MTVDQLFKLIVFIAGGIVTIATAIKVLFGKSIDQHLERKSEIAKLRIDIDKIELRVKEGERLDELFIKDRELLQEAIKLNEMQRKDIEESKLERKLMIKGLISICRRLEETGANGTVSGTRKELEGYLYDMSHR